MVVDVQVMDEKWCPMCEEILSIEKFYIYQGKRPRYGAYCKLHTNELSRAANAARRAAVLDLLGCQCVRCGFDDVRALQIDHVNGGGTAEYKLLGNQSAKFYQRVLEHPDDYQVLCANCNWIKKHENKEVCGRKAVSSSK
jgi:hypothetical protein